MFVQPSRRLAQGAVVSVIGMLALGACDDPTAGTDLRPEGPPDVLAVLVFNDPINGAVESATYCKPNDEKRPAFVGIVAYGLNPEICPSSGAAVPELTDAYPDGWYVRVMFDELLNADIEDLEEILDADDEPTGTFTGTLARTQPVTLQCQDVNGTLVNVPYDGYYSPAGNNVTWPVGPSLVIRPLDPTTVPVESQCQIQLKSSIVDKDGVSVTAADQAAFKFKIAPIQVIGVFPADEDVVDPLTGGVDLTFNVEIDGSTFTTDDYTFGPTVANQYVQQYAAAGLFVGGDVLDASTYEFALTPGAKVSDKCGRESTIGNPADAAVTFDTRPYTFVRTVPFSGMNQRPSNKIRSTFNQYIDIASIGPEDYTITPAIENPAFVIENPNNPITAVLSGQYAYNTTYTFTWKAGATITDIYGVRTYTFAADESVTFTTAAQIELVSASLLDTSTNAVVTITGAGGQTITKSADDATVRVRIGFNQDILGTTYTADDFTLTKADGSPVDVPVAVVASTGPTLSVAGVLPAGSYRFTFKAGSTLTDRLATPTTYTQAADRTFTFNVAVAEPAAPFACLGATP